MIQDLFNLQSKTALVTGGTHGLGMAIAKGLAGAGARIVINDIMPEKLENAIKEYKKDGIDAKAYLFNVTVEDEVKAAIEKIEAEIKALESDILKMLREVTA